MSKNKNFFIGIDLGGKEKMTTGVCILEEKVKETFPSSDWCQKCQVLKGKDLFREIKPYMSKTKAIAIDGPLTKGKGKGKMRLYEKFLSTKIFRKEKVNPLPPALMPGLCDFARELVEKLEKRGFVLDINLIETFPTLVKKISNQTLLILQRSDFCQTEHQRSALVCAQVAFLHSQFKTRYLGYKDGFLFLPETSFWRKDWIKKLSKAWQEKERLKYRRLITNLLK